MKKIYVHSLIIAVIFLLSGIASADDEFRAKLSGDNEVPPVKTNTSGKFQIEFNDDETKAEYELKVRDGHRITQAHIHCGPKGKNGPVVAFLAGFHDRGWDLDGTWIDNATITDDNILPTDGTGTCPRVIETLEDLADAMRHGLTYVNVHSVANPPGEVRGQIKSEDDDDDDSDSDHD